MADKAISELVAAKSVTPDSLFVLQQDNTAKKLTAQVLENWLLSFAEGHGGIQTHGLIKTEGLVKTYRFTFADQTYMDFDVVDGRGVKSVKPTSTNGLVVTYTITYNDSTTDTFTVTNGAKGDKGDNANIWIKYASQKPTAGSHNFGDIPDAWIGIASGHIAEAPTDWQQYTWYQWKGEKGDTGDPATLISSEVTYQVGDSGTIIPSGAWGSSIPNVPQGKYLWTREVTRFNTGNPITKYSVARFGIDGTGSVSSVSNISPDETGNVPLQASDIGALPETGGDLLGELNMNGKPISGLNPPTEVDQATNKGYVDTSVSKARPRNLLDNSDFTNPVNQRGQTSYVGQVGGKYGIDRWNVENEYSTMTINSNGVTFSANGLDTYPFQKVLVTPSMRGKRYTAAICLADGTVCVFANGILPQDIPTMDTQIGTSYFVPGKAAFSLFAHRDGTMMLQIRVIDGQSVSLRWAALYEGEYTAETLPEYQPKGYGAELAECMRYYQRHNLRLNVDDERTFSLPIAMRITPTVGYEVVDGTGTPTYSAWNPSTIYIKNTDAVLVAYFTASADL